MIFFSRMCCNFKAFATLLFLIGVVCNFRRNSAFQNRIVFPTRINWNRYQKSPALNVPPSVHSRYLAYNLPTSTKLFASTAFAETGALLFAFGVIADIQYTNAPDAMNFQGTRLRRYRQSLQIFAKAVEHWNVVSQSAHLENKFTSSIILGDILDGKCASLQSQELCLADVLRIAEESKHKFHFSFGNHCHYCFDRRQLYEDILQHKTSVLHEFSINGINDSSSKHNGEFNRRSYKALTIAPDKLYYDWSPMKGWRFVSLDSYDVSIIGASSLENQAIAKSLLAANNPNNLSESGTWFNNLPFDKSRWVPYNGGCSEQQIKWLQETLESSRQNNERVIIFCHQPIWSPFKPQSLIWNSEEILNIIHASGNVCLWLAGHDHGAISYIVVVNYFIYTLRLHVRYLLYDLIPF